MRQFDLYQNPVSTMRAAVPFVVVLSSHHAAGLTETIVAPVLKGRAATISAFEVPVEHDDQTLLISISSLTAIRQADLRRRIGSLTAHEDDIRRALDRLFTGF